MGAKLRKKISNGKLYYLVSDANENDKYYEFYEFENYKDMPNIENICYKVMATELMNSYDTKPFSPLGYKSILLVKHGLIIDGNLINTATFNLFYDLIRNIRFKDLYNVINSFRKRLSIEVLDFYRDKITQIDVTELSEETQELFETLLKKLNYQKDRKELFKEIMYLATLSEYNKAYKIVYETEKRIKSYPEWNEE